MREDVDHVRMKALAYNLQQATYIHDLRVFYVTQTQTTHVSEQKIVVRNWESVGSSRFKIPDQRNATTRVYCIFIFEGLSAHSLILAALQESQKKQKKRIFFSREELSASPKESETRIHVKMISRHKSVIVKWRI